MKKLTIIGNGSMAFILANSLKEEYELEIVGKDMSNLDIFEKELNKTIKKELIYNFDISNKIILLCVKPNNLKEVSTQIIGKSRILISILAGKSIDNIDKTIDSEIIYRVMPNIYAEIKESITIISGNDIKRELINNIFKNIGETLWIEEDKMDIVTAISGSGPALLAHISDIFKKTGILYGLSETEAKIITEGLFKGFGNLINKTTEEEIIKKVSSPNGTTEEGLKFLKNSDFDILFKKTIYKSYEKSKKINI